MIYFGCGDDLDNNGYLEDKNVENIIDILTIGKWQIVRKIGPEVKNYTNAI